MINISMGNSPHHKRIFLDTSAFIALQDKGDQFHPAAVKLNHYLIENSFDIYTSDYVLDETFTLLKIRAGHAVTKRFGQDIKSSKLIKILNIIPNLNQETRLPCF
jgi:predicted nucleic acid-binding protein